MINKYPVDLNIIIYLNTPHLDLHLIPLMSKESKFSPYNQDEIFSKSEKAACFDRLLRQVGNYLSKINFEIPSSASSFEDPDVKIAVCVMNRFDSVKVVIELENVSDKDMIVFKKFDDLYGSNCLVVLATKRKIENKFISGKGLYPFMYRAFGRDHIKYYFNSFGEKKSLHVVNDQVRKSSVIIIISNSDGKKFFVIATNQISNGSNRLFFPTGCIRSEDFFLSPIDNMNQRIIESHDSCAKALIESIIGNNVSTQEIINIGNILRDSSLLGYSFKNFTEIYACHLNYYEINCDIFDKKFKELNLMLIPADMLDAYKSSHKLIWTENIYDSLLVAASNKYVRPGFHEKNDEGVITQINISQIAKMIKS